MIVEGRSELRSEESIEGTSVRADSSPADTDACLPWAWKSAGITGSQVKGSFSGGVNGGVMAVLDGGFPIDTIDGHEFACLGYGCAVSNRRAVVDSVCTACSVSSNSGNALKLGISVVKGRLNDGLLNLLGDELWTLRSVFRASSLVGGPAIESVDRSFSAIRDCEHKD